MDEKEDRPKRALPPSELSRIDKVCDRFEAAWQAGKQPRIEDFLGDIPQPIRSKLRRELVAIEAERRAKKSSHPSLGQFIESLANSGLLTVEEVRAFRDSLPPERRPRDAQALARELVRAEKLTKYQAGEVYHGKTKGLAFGEYTVLDKIGAGGMGVVLKARHRRMERLVAIKVLPSAAMKSIEAVQRFHREVKAAARLMHPNIVTAHDASEHEGIHYLVMEYVDGKDLAHVVAERGCLSVEQALDYIIQTAKGLEYAHSKGLVHRDIKPGNLILDREGTVKILDMGLARMGMLGGAADTAASECLTETGQIMGTCDYMAPEQAKATHQVDHRADIYSLGCTLYRLLTGQKPFKGKTLMQTLRAHREAPIPSLCEARPDVPAKLDEAFRKMMAKTPEGRYTSMRELIAALEACVPSKQPVPPPVTRQFPGDSALTPFLQHLSDDAAATKQEPRVAEDTLKSHVEQETGRNLWKNLVQLERRNTMVYGGIAAGVAAFVVVLGLLLAIVGGGKETELERDKEAARVGDEKEEPPPAIAPFDADEAKRHQQAWADYLGVPVEITNSIGMKLVLIPPGEFVMGSTDEEIERFLKELKESGRLKQEYAQEFIDRLLSEGPRHRVKITRRFYLGKCEVTVGQFRQFVEATGYRTDAEKDGKGGQPPFQLGYNPEFNWQSPGFALAKDQPVVQVSWNDAVAFCRWLSEEEGKTYRLPTEAEWEYSCRAGSASRYSFGEDATSLGEYGWFRGNSPNAAAHPVGQKKPNAWGLYDMLGNVWEWCADWFAKDYYKQSPLIDPSGPRSGRWHVTRGGSWSGTNPISFRCALRHHRHPHYRTHGMGFRVVCDPFGDGKP